jgi:AcrR family transcriptional regulator
MPTRMAPDPSITDQRILDAARRVFLDEGFRGATTKRIAAEAGVNEVTLFRRFRTKEELLLCALRPGTAADGARLPVPSVDAEAELIAWCQAKIHHLARVRGLLRAAMDKLEAQPELCARASEGPAEIRRELASWFGALRDAGRASGDWRPETAARLLLGAMFGEVMRPDAPTSPAPDTLDTVAAEYARLTLRAIGWTAAAVDPTPESP